MKTTKPVFALGPISEAMRLPGREPVAHKRQGFAWLLGIRTGEEVAVTAIGQGPRGDDDFLPVGLAVQCEGHRHHARVAFRQINPNSRLTGRCAPPRPCHRPGHDCARLAATLALAGHRPSRKLAGEQKAAVWLAALLASGWKDRSACNLCVVVDFNRALHPTMDEWKFLSDSDLTTLATDLVQPVERRMLAAWLLAGTKRYWNVNVPTDNARPRWSLMKVMADSGMPLIFYWLADRAATRGGGCMFVSFLPLWQIFQGATREIELRSNSLPNQERIGPLLSAAYDMHTREGRAALQMLARTPGVGSVLAPAPPEARLSALFAAVFAVEGGLLNLRLSLPEFDRVHFEATTVELAYYGLTASSQAQALVHAAGSHLQRLHHLRLSVLQAVDRTAQVSGPTAAPLAGATNLPAQAALPLLGAPQRYKMGSPITLPEKDLASLLGSGGAWRTDEGFL
ncbi:hypothetical protein [Phenylobacterium sp. NIBR 498073]|uniref:hypothetical protein n=1 Tax=Phenylobacterium sp. NIBR 498073 TaxID=3015177 RepID=UPI0022B45CE8|nr:hypothetical protein [Phenylobacterium sp. NIBR 498073]WGU40935.1 hypothetical protein O4N75_04220 [Phenylobacterium sp. NIBR 498073]